MGDERRDRIQARVAADLRLSVAWGETPKEDGSPRILGRGFLDQVQMRNATLLAIKGASVETRDPLTKKPRLVASPFFQHQNPSQHFRGRPLRRGHRGAAPYQQSPRGKSHPSSTPAGRLDHCLSA